jgi:hypothetical protein
MVFTESVRIHTRRRVLGLAVAGVSGAALAGCGLFDHEAKPTAATTDTLQPLLTEAVALAAAYDRAVAAQPGLAGRLTPLAADHRAHASELARLIGQAVPPAYTPTASALVASGSVASGSAAPAGAGDVLARLRAAEQTAQRNAVAACLKAPAERAALVGSIAACRATHAEALR